MNTKRMTSWMAGVILGVASGAVAADAPAFNNLRYEENSAAYRDVPVVSPVDEIKYIPLGESEDLFLSLGGQVRLRGESWENFGFGPVNDDNYGLARLRIHGDLHLGAHVRVFVEGKHAGATERDLPGGRRNLDVDDLDLQNGFVDVMSDIAGDWSGTLRVGRQELSYGAQRLVSPLDWSNTRRTWDGARIIVKNPAWRVDAFATEYVPVEKHDFNEAESDQKFSGVYETHTVADLGLKYEFYLLALDRDDLSEGRYSNDERYTAGLRLAGTCKLTGIEYDIEGGWQFGDADEAVADAPDRSVDIDAWFFSAELGYTLADLAMKPRVYAGYDYASGDSDPADGDAGTFNPLFPLGHAFFGYIDIIGRQNIQDISGGVSCWPVENKVQVKLDYHLFERAESADALYNAGGAVVRPADPAASKDVGSELDLTINWKVSRSVLLNGGYSHFFAGDFIEETGADSDIDFAYVSAQYTF